MSRGALAAITAFLLLPSAAFAEIAEHPYLAGILEVPKVFGEPDPKGPPGAKHYVPGKLTVYPDPQKKKWPPPKSVEAPEDLGAEEFDYERSGAAVYSVRKGWYEVALKEGRGWVRARDAGPFHALEDLVTGKLSFLTKDWDGRLWGGPHEGTPRKLPLGADKEYGAQVLTSKKTQGALWLQVRVMSGVGCESEAKPVAVGWVPAHQEKGKLNVWFYPRGC